VDIAVGLVYQAGLAIRAIVALLATLVHQAGLVTQELQDGLVLADIAVILALQDGLVLAVFLVILEAVYLVIVDIAEAV